MKAKILVGAVAALFSGGVALADEGKDCPPGYEKQQTQASLAPQEVDEEGMIIETEPAQEGVGGGGQAGQEQDLTVDDPASVDQDLIVDDPAAIEQDVQDPARVDEGFGGSGKAGQGEMILRCEPVRSGTGVGGSGEIDQGLDSGMDSTGGSGFQSEPLREPPVAPPPAPVTPVEPSTEAFTPTIEDDEEITRRESPANMRGLTVMVGGGVEGYTGALAPEINPGAAYGVTAALKPSKVLGLELGYSGAVNELDAALADTDGPDLVRNGGQAAVTLGLGAAPVQPYLLGGIGFSDYNFRGGAQSEFGDDTVGQVPVGAGLRTHVGSFTADLRANYNFLFDQEFDTSADDGFSENGSYSGTLNIGGTF